MCVWIAGLAGLRGLVQQALGAWSSGDCWVRGVGVWGSMALVGLRRGPKDWGSHSLQSSSYAGLWVWAWHTVSAVLSVYGVIWCPGEAFHELGAQSADVSALPCALPHLSVSPASQQGPWVTELRRSVAVSQSPSWISPWYHSWTV
jgi:hypothetical protein